MLILINYGGGVNLPFKFPAALAAALLGGILAWISTGLGYDFFNPPNSLWRVADDWYPFPWGLHMISVSDSVPQWPLLAALSDSKMWGYAPVIIPLALQNVVGDFANTEAANLVGDMYDAREVLVSVGCYNMIAAIFGCPFPVTVFIGHSAIKGMGARSGYSLVTGCVVALLCFINGGVLVLHALPVEAAIGVLFWVGVVITAQAFDGATEKKGLSIAVAIGLLPALAAWVLGIIDTSLTAAGTSLGQLYIHGNNTGLTLTLTLTLIGGQLYIHGNNTGGDIKTFADQRFFLSGIISLSQR